MILLLETGNRPIVEDSRKDDYWGAKTVGDEGLSGQNVLGRLLMELREKLKATPDALKIVEPPPLSKFLLLDHPVPTILAHVPGDMLPPHQHVHAVDGNATAAHTKVVVEH